jgi:hypothetical protein
MTSPTIAQYEDMLGRLAMQYRRTADQSHRRKIAQEYSVVVNHLIQSGAWHESPPPEDQLPFDDMPTAYFQYWNQ